MVCVGCEDVICWKSNKLFFISPLFSFALLFCLIVSGLRFGIGILRSCYWMRSVLLLVLVGLLCLGILFCRYSSRRAWFEIIKSRSCRMGDRLIHLFHALKISSFVSAVSRDWIGVFMLFGWGCKVIVCIFFFLGLQVFLKNKKKSSEIWLFGICLCIIILLLFFLILMKTLLFILIVLFLLLFAWIPAFADKFDPERQADLADEIIGYRMLHTHLDMDWLLIEQLSEIIGKEIYRLCTMMNLRLLWCATLVYAIGIVF